MVLVLCLCHFVSCGRCGRKDGEISTAPDAHAAVDAAADIMHEPVKWKEESGKLLPSDETPFGTPVPGKMRKVTSGKTWCRYEGTWKVDEVLKFYKTYLKLPEGTAMEVRGRAHVFDNARPVFPGNPGRIVQVRVVDEKDRGLTAIMIFDISKQPQKDWDAVPPYDPRTWKPSKPGDWPPEHLE